MDSMNAGGAVGTVVATGGLPSVGVAAGRGAPVRSRNRIESIDLLRGLIMAIMMLDHTRDFVHFQALDFDPTDPARTGTVLFFTRWITHFCAPVFVFLAGTGAGLQQLRGKPKAELSRFLFTRGVWFIAFELVFLRPIVFLNMDYDVLLAFLQVIWAIGCSMVVLAALIHLPLRAVAVFSLVMIAGHNLLDGIRINGATGLGLVWKILHEPGPISLFGSPGFTVWVLYPLIPWVGVMSAGYVFARLYSLGEAERRRLLLGVGAGLALGFVILRALNVYGDPVRWSVQPTAMKTVYSFLAASKYPPSLLYLMMTLGPALIFLGWSERHTRGRFARILITYGNVPLFFYLLQWIVAHVLGILAARLAGKPTTYLFGNLFLSPPPAPGYGFGLPVVYALWILGLLMIYPLCRWFVAVKTRRRDWWLSYL